MTWRSAKTDPPSGHYPVLVEAHFGGDACNIIVTVGNYFRFGRNTGDGSPEWSFHLPYEGEALRWTELPRPPPRT